MGTNYTQCIYRIRLRPVTPQSCVDDLVVIYFKNFQHDPSLGHFRGEPTLFDEAILFLLELPTTRVTTQNETENSPPVTRSFRFPMMPVPVPIGLYAALAPLPLTALAAALALPAPDR